MYWAIKEFLIGVFLIIFRVLQEKEGEPQPSKDTQTEGESGKANEEHEGGLEKGEKESSESEKDKDSSQSKCWSQNKLKTMYRKFNVDLAPKVIFNP